MENVIKLQARYGWKHKLEQISGDCWKLVLDPKGPQSYRCIGFEHTDFKQTPCKIYAIDPDGGPFLSVGSTIENYTIDSIMSNGIIWLKQNKNENS
jgi:hypothetical protein